MAETPTFRPFVPAETDMKEFTLRALLIGLVMCVILGAANAYLGLKAGMTIAATYPAAVIGMALLRLMKGSILEENFARTVGSIGESVAAGAIFTIPAFFISGIWDSKDPIQYYMQATAIMLVGGIIGVLFVTLLRRVMVEDATLPFPESVAASEIHKAGQSGGGGAGTLFAAMGIGAFIQILGKLNVFAASWEKFVSFARAVVPGSKSITANGIVGQGGTVISTPGVSPAYIGVGYIIGPRLASLNFSGGLLAWGLFVPLLMFLLGPSLYDAKDFEKITSKYTAVATSVDARGVPQQYIDNASKQVVTIDQYRGMIESDYDGWIAIANKIWRYFVRPIAIGGMLVSAGNTLYKMRKNLGAGLKRSVSDVKKAASGSTAVTRTEKDLPLTYVLAGIVLCAIATFFIYNYFSGAVAAALTATVVMLIAGFFFAAVSGYLVGMIGSSNNPISGLTISAVIISALLMVVLGMKGVQGVSAVLGVAAVVCVSAAVAGEMLQDLKVGHILGGTPWKMQVGDLIGVVVASLVMFFPLMILQQSDMKSGGLGFGGKALPAPQAGLMSLLSQGIVGGEMAWPLIIVGMLMAVAFILTQVKSPMLVCVGMYLPLETTFAIFIGGLVRGLVDRMAEKKQFNLAQKTRVENAGVLVASGLIAGEALMGLVFAGLKFYEVDIPVIFQVSSFITSIGVFIVIGLVLTLIPIKKAGAADEPAPPSAAF
ncbi:MAG: oligopeptide transporter, OPT family [Ignavibacteriales bacterium]|nr:oligopeptide transporter, OPT family [Ignavibacteriales bacterium]